MKLEKLYFSIRTPLDWDEQSQTWSDKLVSDYSFFKLVICESK